MHPALHGTTTLLSVGESILLLELSDRLRLLLLGGPLQLNFAVQLAIGLQLNLQRTIITIITK